jgi:hypothetical protein
MAGLRAKSLMFTSEEDPFLSSLPESTTRESTPGDRKKTIEEWQDRRFPSNPFDLNELVDDCGRGDLQLPDFQRCWVWDEDRIKSLIAAIY